MATEVFPHLDGERDEVAALRAWSKKRIAELEAENARLRKRIAQLGAQP